MFAQPARNEAFEKVTQPSDGFAKMPFCGLELRLKDVGFCYHTVLWEICARKTIMLEAFTVEPKNDCIIVIIPYILHKTN